MRNLLEDMSSATLFDAAADALLLANDASQVIAVNPAFITISAQITIQDNGPGLTDATARRIFEPFFTTKAHGIGMGLAICRNLIETHGGWLWLDSNARPGATFHLTPPTAP